MFQQIAKLKIKPKQECFTHYDGDTDTYRSFLIWTMQEFIKDYPDCAMIKKTTIPITGNVYDHVLSNRGIERDRVNRLKAPYLNMPAIGIQWPWGDNKNPDESEVIIVDGNHRMVKFYEMGITKINAIIFAYPFWEEFMVCKDLQAKMVAERDLLNGDSGILKMEREDAERNN